MTTSSQSSSPQPSANSSTISSNILSNDAGSMEILRHRAAQQLQNYSQVMQKQQSSINSNIISANNSISDIQNNFYLQQSGSIKNSHIQLSQPNQEHRQSVYSAQQQTATLVQQKFYKSQNSNTVLNSLHQQSLANFAEQQLHHHGQVGQRHVNVYFIRKKHIIV